MNAEHQTRKPSMHHGGPAIRAAILFAGVLGLAAAVALISACDGGSDASGSFSISPSSVRLKSVDTSVVLTERGGHGPFVWSVSDETRGEVTGDGESVTYTRTDVDGGNTVRVIDSRGYEATAQITQSDKSEDSPVAISPTSATLANNGDKVIFEAVGGTAPYHWQVVDSSRGDISVKNTAQVIYKRIAAGNNTVTVIDDNGFAAVAAITQPGTPTLAISPSSVTVSTNGVQVFTAVGGSGTYTWAIASGNGFVSPATGASTVYTSVDGGTDVISLSDGLTTVFATIGKP